MGWLAEDVCRIVGGEFITPVHSGQVIAVSTDTRQLQPGDWFVALTGANFDGHDFLRDAVKKGAGGCIVAREFVAEEELDRVPVVRVKDTLLALGDLARQHRSTLDARVVAVTGSNGKTTTTQMIAHVLGKGARVLRTEKSFNNAIGLPLTLLRGRPDHEFAVLELGTSGPGEIAYLAGIARPHVGVITTVSETHLEGLKSVEGVARAKAELLDHIDANGLAVLNQDNEMTRAMARRRAGRTVTFGLFKESTVTGSEVETGAAGLRFRVSGVPFVVPVLGAWNVYNALAAAAVCTNLGLTLGQVAERLGDFKLPPMRMERSVVRGVTLINDAYNANPKSVLLALDELDQMATAGRKLLVFGEMGELGPAAATLHKKVGERIAQLAPAALVTVGAAARVAAEIVEQAHGKRTQVFSVATAEEAGEALLGLAREGDVVLFKGSRLNALERALERFRAGHVPSLTSPKSHESKV
ncbi:MAG: UDP-N-acetylmuramoyl-tripeptide--D-alanyl-D-alanine ligase [Planctomycetes bacterium]|nr:UDP-N-acetylmuramoyl-tripeptide--D-alanyl-D-alanine ligase [Planctomycetota bacterium]